MHLQYTQCLSSGTFQIEGASRLFHQCLSDDLWGLGFSGSSSGCCVPYSGWRAGLFLVFACGCFVARWVSSCPCSCLLPASFSGCSSEYNGSYGAGSGCVSVHGTILKTRGGCPYGHFRSTADPLSEDRGRGVSTPHTSCMVAMRPVTRSRSTFCTGQGPHIGPGVTLSAAAAAKSHTGHAAAASGMTHIIHRRAFRKDDHTNSSLRPSAPAQSRV